jgi:DNA polymerase III subunit alpha
MTFTHLHCHTQFSLLDGAANIKNLISKAKADGMPGMAITDHGNMFGVFEFVAEAQKQGIKPIVGCEFYLVEDRHKREFTKDQKDRRHHQLLLAKNQEGYKNLSKLCSMGYIEGIYGKYPRIDKEILLQYHENLIATTCCIGAEVPQAILHQGEAVAEEKFKWWLDIFGEDYYVELQRHNIPEQEEVNAVLLKFAKKYNVKIIASNDSHYVDKEDATAHDILLCVNTGEFKSTPVGEGKGFRFGFPNEEFYFKTTSEMDKLFHDLPQALDNTNEIVDKIEPLKLKRDILLPNFPIPAGFTDGDDYLRHLTFEGAARRYGQTADTQPGLPAGAWQHLRGQLLAGENGEVLVERLDFELHTIRTMGFAGYFLIVSDFIQAGRDLGVMVGPGRGSAAGSVVAYCIGITNIDPIKYQLLFERFLNPDRKSMPDIDTDFDDAGRQKVIDYVVQKYGKNQVAQIVTYGTMATKSSIKDVARVMQLPLNEANAVVKLIPDRPTYNMDFQKLIHLPLDKLADIVQTEEVENCRKVREFYKADDLMGKVLRQAEKLEGNIRNTGVHAAGIIIAPSDLTNILPVCTSKESDLFVTQYEGRIIEDAGVIKMDFLGLRNLTIIRDCLLMIRQNYNLDIDIDSIDLEDKATYELFQRGEMNAVFQFESDGMKKHMRDLKPDRFGDLIAMNALYRPGPIAYIPNYINRKHGREEIKYDLPEMEEFLAETYGITVYQEQVMLISQKIAGFTKGDADVLRKAMGKKDRATLDKMKGKFMEGAVAKGFKEDKLNKIWTDWEAFAAYAFNKSHSTCYAFVAYQTAWLKTHYPAEYMAAVLTSSMGNIEKITFFLDECKNMGLNVLGPDVNESQEFFGVNERQQIRFGLKAIKGAGEAAVSAIIEERRKNGKFTDFWNFVRRVPLRTVNKKTFESLAYAGAFDCFPAMHRAVYFHVPPGEEQNMLEKAVRYGNTYHAEKASAQNSLFGGSQFMEVPPPRIPDCEKWSDIEKLNFENQVVGFFLSGHPLDSFRLEMKSFCNTRLNEVLENWKNRNIAVAGIVGQSNLRQSKNGNYFVVFNLQDYNGTLELALYGEDFMKMGHLVKDGQYLYLKGKVMSKWGRPDEWEVKISSLQLLTEIRRKLTKSLNLNLNVNQLQPETLENLVEAVRQSPGDCQLKIQVWDEEENIRVETFSRNLRIMPTDELIAELSRLPGASFELVK